MKIIIPKRISLKRYLTIFLFLITFLTANENRLLFFGNCISCHGEIRKPSAPAMLEVKGYYLAKYPNKEDFVKHLANWVHKPNEENALVKDAIKKYNLMPYLSIDLDTLRKIATYIYENDDFGVKNGYY